MLRKPAIVTVTPAVAGRDYRAATHNCVSYPPDGDGGDTDPPVDPGPTDPLVPEPGTVIILETPDGEGGYDMDESVAPAPPGYVCRNELIFITIPGEIEPVATYTIVCTLPE